MGGGPGRGGGRGLRFRRRFRRCGVLAARGGLDLANRCPMSCRRSRAPCRVCKRLMRGVELTLRVLTTEEMKAVLGAVLRVAAPFALSRRELSSRFWMVSVSALRNEAQSGRKTSGRDQRNKLPSIGVEKLSPG